MGAGPQRCCSVSTPNVRKNPRASSAGRNSKGPSTDDVNIKIHKHFKENYRQAGIVGTNGRKTIVVCNHFGNKLLCRKIDREAMPCQDIRALKSHFQALRGLFHPNVCRFVDVFEDNSSLYLLYEKANTTTLFDYIRARASLKEDEAADYLRQAARALAVAHSSGIVHGRLSPKSLLLADENDEIDEEEADLQVMICDFGQGFVLRPDIFKTPETPERLRMETYAVSPEMASQELVQTDGSVPKGADMNDIWALGVIFYHMLSGTLPFKVTSRQDLVQQMTSKHVRYNDAMWNRLSPSARDLIEQMIMLNPKLRISAPQILKHSWVKVAKATFPRKKMLGLLHEMQRTVKECEFKQFVLRVIAERLPNDGKHLTTVENAYRVFDKNGDGVLTVEEVVAGLQKHLDKAMNNTEVKELFAQLDRDGSHTFSLQEFVSASIPQSRSTSLPVLWEVFSAFDKDRSGHIKLDEVEALVAEIEGGTLNKEQVLHLCQQIRFELEAAGSHGGIDFDEFVYIMRNPHPNCADAVTKDCNRLLWNCCGVDKYGVRNGTSVDQLTGDGRTHNRWRKRWS